ncbi:DUF2155 domain-containing protein [Candidatus Pelagibacter sp.]|nr:DUF2155 domain-containing protein [Candidatus Pelagibacter sp.]MDA9663459.1 DUF2155 domain-containing protein [Candidatus Pelagibacter sp.]
MQLLRNIIVGKINFFILLIYFFLTFAYASENFIELKILDKVSSKNEKIILKIDEEQKYKDLSIKFLKCINSEFDDNPEVTAYLQVKDLNNNDNNEVFVFNGWTFASSPSLRPFDHPVYDVWLIRCF